MKKTTYPGTDKVVKQLGFYTRKRGGAWVSSTLNCILLPKIVLSQNRQPAIRILENQGIENFSIVFRVEVFQGSPWQNVRGWPPTSSRAPRAW